MQHKIIPATLVPAGIIPTIVAVLSLALPTPAVDRADAATPEEVTVTNATVTNATKRTVKKTRVRTGATTRYRGGPYGFLPGVRSPEAIEIEGSRRYGYGGGGYGGYGWYGSRYYGYPVGVATFYHGRWNGGSFGPCWTRTPAGMAWNCGR